jgi:DNA-binding NtrC family response regulator
MAAALVIEEDPGTQAMLRQMLLERQWEVETSTRASLAEHLATTAPPDVVFLDIEPPDYVPEALAASLRMRFGPELPIAGIGETADPDVLHLTGAFQFLRKPVDGVLLSRVLARAAALRSRSAALRAHSDGALGRLRDLRPGQPESG